MPLANKQDDEQVHELRDLEVQEVSLVDRPANQRKFLIVKSAGGHTMAKGSELQKDGQGGLEGVSAEVDTEDTAPAGDAEAPTEVSEEETPGDEFEEVELGEFTIDEEVAKAMGAALGRAAKRLAALAAAIDNAEKVKGSSPSPALMRQVSAIARTLSSFGDKADAGGKDDKDAKKEEDLDLLAVAADIEADVEKAGRKMSRSRLKQFRQIRDMIGKILDEVDDEEKADTTKADDRFTVLEEKVAALLKATSDQQVIIKSQSEALKKSKSSRPDPNSGTVEDEESLSRVKKSWPLNFNAEETPDEDIFG